MSVIVLQGTTPLLTTYVEGYDLTNTKAIRLSIKNQGRVFVFDKNRITAVYDGQDTALMVHLTQEDTLRLRGNKAKLQVRWKGADDEVYGTDPDYEADIIVKEVYDKAVI